MRSEWLQTLHQESLENLIHKLFPNQNIISNARKGTAIKDKSFLEVDVWLPELRLCFEFQDFYHYKPAWYSQRPLDVIKQIDNNKRVKLMKDAQTVIVVPCWWDGDAASLQASIHFQSPHLVIAQHNSEISSNPPYWFYEEAISNDSKLMLASFPDPDVMERGEWWIGEKWDGIRCFWDTKEKQLYSRSNIAIDLKSHIDVQRQSLELDGELWCGRGSFDESQAIMINDLPSPDTSFLRLLCFDEASLYTQVQPFEARYSLILSQIPEDHPTIINAPRFLCLHDTLLQDTLHNITGEGGEGVMLRQPLSPYLPGNSKYLFKLKASYTYRDQEALVKKVEADGSLMLQLPNGDTFTVQKENCVLHRQPEQGNIISFKTNFASPVYYHDIRKSNIIEHEQLVVYRIREDLSWQDVVRSVPAETNSHEMVQHPGFQSWKVIETRRSFFDKFAASKGIDPLSPTSWYGVTPSELSQYNSKYHSIAHNTNLYTVLAQVYPDISLRKEKFKAPQALRQIRKEFFDRFAASLGMDPLNPVFWYNITRTEISKEYDAISKYGVRLPKILIHAYPNIGLKQERFKSKEYKLLEKRRDYRRFFSEFAASKGMDPHNPVFWASVTPLELARYSKKYTEIAEEFGVNLPSILAQLFPGITALTKVTQARNLERERLFFDNFASSKGEDPLNPEFWYTVTLHDIRRYNELNNQGYKALSRYFAGELSSIIIQVYPNIGLQLDRFKVLEPWKLEGTRRAFFDKYAASKGMDPLNPVFWGTVTPSDLTRANKVYTTISAFYGFKLSRALVQLYPDIGLKLRDLKG